ncbi:MAG: stage V sporulation protein S [Oscillospiraceae bacterium]|jgi:stage V sporulation protein S|nr:stage V sporulation protein S [Oscillospiraceae bacterium]
MELIKVSARSVPKLVAGAIAAVVREKKIVEIQAVGAGAINQAVKSIAIARIYTSEEGLNLICKPAFTNVDIDGTEKTAIQFITEVLPIAN